MKLVAIVVIIVSAMMGYFALSTHTTEEQVEISEHEGERPPPVYAAYIAFAPEMDESFYITPTIPTPTPTPEPTPIPVPTAAPKLPTPAPAAVSAAAAPSGIPWFVPANFHEAYLECINSDYRYAVWAHIESYTDWNIDEIRTRILPNEGGGDSCQFNTGGSGACGPFQILPCPPNGLKPEVNVAAAHAKWADTMCGDGGHSFYCHWYRFWAR